MVAASARPRRAGLGAQRADLAQRAAVPASRDRPWRPDLIKSNGGGANAILVRGAAITEPSQAAAALPARAARRPCRAARRRNLGWQPPRAGPPHELARRDARRAAEALHEWAADAPAILGGDLNVPVPVVPGFTAVGGFGVDHVFARGFAGIGEPELPDRGGLSDHAAVIVELGRT